MGVTVRQKRPGKGKPWWVFVHQDGLIKSKLVGDKRAAEAVAAALRRKVVAGELKLNVAGAASIPTFTEYAERHMEGYVKTALKATTQRGYRDIIDHHLKPAWRGKRLTEINRSDVKQLLLQKQKEGLAPNSIANIRALVSGIFTHAYEDQIVQHNPALRLGKYIPKFDRLASVRPLTREQVVTVLEAAKKHEPDHYALLLCAFRTGMRMGELLGLAWSDVDFEANTIEVKRAYTQGAFTTPKSHKSRVVDMSDQLKQALLAHRDALRVRFGGDLPATSVPALVKGKPPVLVCLLFPCARGGPLDGDNLRSRVFGPLLEKADVPKHRFHDIRHTFASLLLQQNESVHYVKEQMGHASIQTTVDVYGHLVPGSNRNAVNRLDDAAGPALKIAGAAG